MTTYRINEIFYSLQGEGRHTGRAAVFIRFSGCNLRCPFCDTDFSTYQLMSTADIISATAPWKDCRFVVLTGGEPALQVDDTLVDALHSQGFQVAIETNGTHALPEGIDWVTLSPKNAFADRSPAIVLTRADEVKVVFDGIHDPESYARMEGHPYLCLQPCDTGDRQQNDELIRQCVAYIKRHPHWHLSLQTHKIINIP